MSSFLITLRIEGTAYYFRGQLYWFDSVNPKGFSPSLENLFTDGSLAEILIESSLARLVDVLFDMLRVRKLFHRRMWFLMSHLSCSWREVLITLFKEHTRKNLRDLKSVLSHPSGCKFLEMWKADGKQCCTLLWYTSYLAILLANFKISHTQVSLLPNYTHHPRTQYLKGIQGE